MIPTAHLNATGSRTTRLSSIGLQLNNPLAKGKDRIRGLVSKSKNRFQEVGPSGTV